MHNYVIYMHDLRLTQAVSSGSPSTKKGRAKRRIVIKLGSRTLTEDTDSLSASKLTEVAAAVVAADDVEIVIVSSGAVAAGFRILGHTAPPDRLQDRQAAAAVGQSRLMRMWSDVFEAQGRHVGQVLLTGDCLTDRSRYISARGALSALLEGGIVPIVNENDTVSVEEIMVGDNDNLAAITAALVDADLLVLLTDVDGVYSTKPAAGGSATPIPFAASASVLRDFCFKKTSTLSRGGMATKLEAAEKASIYGIPTVIASGGDPEALTAILRGDAVGTYIAAEKSPLGARRHWMSVHKPRGSVVVDDGAVAALRRRASLLPSGVIEVVGRFRKGDLVAVLDRSGAECARGLVRFDDRDVDRIRGLHSTQVSHALGRAGGAIIMRPDRMVIAQQAVP
jgi:glutamate 5-kinase